MVVGISSAFLKRNISKYFLVNNWTISYFSATRALMRTNLNFLHMILCGKYGWNWLCTSREKEDIVKCLQTDWWTQGYWTKCNQNTIVSSDLIVLISIFINDGETVQGCVYILLFSSQWVTYSFNTKILFYNYLPLYTQQLARTVLKLLWLVTWKEQQLHQTSKNKVNISMFSFIYLSYMTLKIWTNTSRF